jgi:hypothetical protein
MKIQALNFLSHIPERPQRVTLDADSPEVLKNALKTDAPAAFLLATGDLQYFRKFADLVVDRRKQLKPKSLSMYLLRKDKIPLIESLYSNVGQMKRGIRTLLANAVAIGERNVYMIGADDSLFRKTCKHAAEFPPGKIVSWGGKPGRGFFGGHEVFEGGSTVTRFLLDVFGDHPEPPELAQKYVGESPAAKLVRQFILHAANTKSTVMILGDTGTGKEIVARMIHKYSDRAKEKFCAVNCGGIPHELLESDLFGHEKGAFSGAVGQKIGLWESAGGGTLFLDEVGDLSLAHQVKILRVLEDRKIRRIGSTSEIPVSARIISATNRDLFSMVRDGRFREDLYYRLREFLIRTPSLRDYPDDIPLIAQSLWKGIAGDGQSPLSREILEELKTLRWPGNARELKAVLSSVYSFVSNRNIRPEYLKAIFLSLDMSPRLEPQGRWRTTVRKLECINHLRRVEEVVHATGAAIDSFGKKRRLFSGGVVDPMADLMRQRSGELEVLCLQPLLFHNESVFTEVNRFKGNLVYFQCLLQKDTREAVRYVKNNVKKKMNHLAREIGRELRLLLSATS